MNKKQLLSTILSVPLAVSMSAPAFAASRLWEDPYATTIRQKTTHAGSITQLVDLDVDGTPELLIGSIPGSGRFSTLMYAYTFKDGALQQLRAPEDLMISTGTGLNGVKEDYALYRNNATGAYRVEGGFTVRAGVGNYDTLVANYALNNGTITNNVTFRTSVVNKADTYYVGNTLVTPVQYSNALEARNNGWTRVATFKSATFATSGVGKPTSIQIDNLISGYVSGPALAQASASKLQVDGKQVPVTAYTIGGNNYFKLRDVASMLNGTDAQFQVGWDSKLNQITLTTKTAYTAAGGELAPSDGLSRFGELATSPIYINGKTVPANLTAYSIDGNNYFKLRDLGEALEFDVGWDAATSTITITTESK